jgi:hypothetical protein
MGGSCGLRIGEVVKFEWVTCGGRGTRRSGQSSSHQSVTVGAASLAHSLPAFPGYDGEERASISGRHRYRHRCRHCRTPRTSSTLGLAPTCVFSRQGAIKGHPISFSASLFGPIHLRICNDLDHTPVSVLQWASHVQFEREVAAHPPATTLLWLGPFGTGRCRSPDP